MAQGCIVRRCPACGNRRKDCSHKGVKYAVVYLFEGHQRWETVGSNRHDAERRLTQVMAEIRQETYRLPTRIVFQEFAAQWLRDYARGAVKPLTFRVYRTLLKTRLIPTFGNLLLTQITQQGVQGFLAKCLHENKLSPKTANSLLLLLKLILKHACEWGHLARNPAASVKPVRVEPKEMAFLCPDEIQRFLKQADEPYRTLFLTALLTGMRRGELLGLQWGDLDWHNNRIHVRRTLYCHTKEELAELGESQKWRFSTPKSQKSIRTIVMSPKLRDALELHRLVCPRSPYDLVFGTKQGQPLHAENVVKKEFLPTLSRAGLRRIRFHDLRHTYTTLLIAQGVHAKFIQAQLGHASIETTMDCYGHLLPEVGCQVGEQLDSQVFGAHVVALANAGANGSSANTG